jgi:hypothetical protein
MRHLFLTASVLLAAAGLSAAQDVVVPAPPESAPCYPAAPAPRHKLFHHTCTSCAGSGTWLLPDSHWYPSLPGAWPPAFGTGPCKCELPPGVYPTPLPRGYGYPWVTPGPGCMP